MRVTFYATRPDGSGQDVVATIALQGAEIVYTGAESYVQLLFDRGQLEQGAEAVEAVREAMRLAPYRFDGAYLRASYEE